MIYNRTRSANLFRLSVDARSRQGFFGYIDGSLEETTINSDLLERTVEIALEEILRESDSESSAFDAGLYGHFAAISSNAFQLLQEVGGSPSVLLDSTSRIAFVLHHVLRYKISEPAATTTRE